MCIRDRNGIGESRQEPVAGRDLKVSLDVNIQAYCQQAAEKAMAEKQADSVSILLMNPQNGEIYACVNVPEFDLNDPFMLQQDTTGLSEKEIQDLLNQMWRNACINDTYEPGSTFKIITMSAGLSEGVVFAERFVFLSRLQNRGGPPDPLPQADGTRSRKLRAGRAELVQPGVH